jgi:hypothetical protein
MVRTADSGLKNFNPVTNKLSTYSNESENENSLISNL